MECREIARPSFDLITLRAMYPTRRRAARSLRPREVNLTLYPDNKIDRSIVERRVDLNSAKSGILLLETNDSAPGNPIFSVGPRLDSQFFLSRYATY